MSRRRVNGYDISYIEVGEGMPLVCVHGTLGDFRVWSPVMGPLSQGHRVISISLRHFFPEHWDGVGTDYTIAQHVADVVGFIEAMDEGPVDLMGHSRGGHIAFRVAQQRPDLLRRLVLAEPVGDLDASLLPPGAPPPVHTVGTRYKVTAERVATGDIDGALTLFAENYDGPGAWDRVPPTVRQTWRDNARTLIGQADERRQPFTRADAEAISVPTLIIIGADTPGALPSMSRALAAHVRGSRVEVIRDARHFMFEDDPMRTAQQSWSSWRGRRSTSRRVAVPLPMAGRKPNAGPCQSPELTSTGAVKQTQSGGRCERPGSPVRSLRMRIPAHCGGGHSWRPGTTPLGSALALRAVFP